MKKIIILLISFNSLIFSAHSGIFEDMDSGGYPMSDGNVFSDHIRGSHLTLDYKTVTNNTDNVMYVQVFYEGNIISLVATKI